METYFVRFPDRAHSASRVLWSAGIAGATILSIFLGYNVWLPANVVARNVYVDGIELSSISAEQLPQRLSQADYTFPNPQVTLIGPDGDQRWSKSAAELGLTWNTNQTIDAALQVGRTGPWWQQLSDRVQSWWRPHHITPSYQYDESAVQAWLTQLAPEVNKEGRHPAATIAQGQVTIDAGAEGRQIATESALLELENRAGEPTQLSLPVEYTHVPLTADGQIMAQTRLNALVDRTITLTTRVPNEPVITLEAEEFFPWLQLPSGFHTGEMTQDLISLTEPFNRDPQNAVFTLADDGETVTEFAPHRAGRAIRIDELVPQILARLAYPLEESIAPAQSDSAADSTDPNELLVPVQETQPQVTLAETNTLGITERIGVGYSTFLHSIPNRVHNVALTSSRIHATLVPAGETFSFNAAVGPINASTGYKTAYVIRNGRTELGDGGGVCQVSTTVFRAALDAGLPITKWKPHSYRVGYYEQNMEPGFDATVYAPSTDFQFTNDTGHAVIVATETDVALRELTVEIWGTSDGRQSEIHDYRMWNQRGAPAAQYIDDPSLPKGTLKQIDWAAPGASTEFTYTVTNADGSERFERKFTSHFQPWKAIFLVGTRE